jgi:hypothetical protein
MQRRGRAYDNREHLESTGIYSEPQNECILADLREHQSNAENRIWVVVLHIKTKIQFYQVDTIWFN